MGTWKKNNGFDANGSYSPYGNSSVNYEQFNNDSLLAQSPSQQEQTRNLQNSLTRPRTLVEKARMNVA